MENGGMCSRRGTPLVPSTADPRPACGGTSRTFERTLTAKQGQTPTLAREVRLELKADAKTSAHLGYFVQSPNESVARRRALEQALADIEAAVLDRENNIAQNATKRALEAIHELADCLKRNEWSQTGWHADEIGLWHAHIGARNAAHHTSSPVVTLHSDPPTDEQLRWAITPAAFISNPSRKQTSEYNARLDGQAVLPSLRRLVPRVTASVA